MFKQHCRLSWPDVRTAVQPFKEKIKKTWPDLHDELQGMRDRSLPTHLPTLKLTGDRSCGGFGSVAGGYCSVECANRDRLRQIFRRLHITGMAFKGECFPRPELGRK